MENELDLIIKKAFELFHNYGIRSVSMDDIARELGMSKKTVYKFITDKHDLLKKVVEHELSHNGKCFMEIVSKGLNAIEEMLEVHRLLRELHENHLPTFEFDLRKYYPEIYKEVIKVRRERIYQLAIANMLRGKEQGLYRADLNEKVIAIMLVARSENPFPDEMNIESLKDVQPFFKEMFNYHIRGICSEAGLKFYEAKIKNNIDTK